MKICVIDSSVQLKKGTTVNVHEHNCRIIIRYLERRGIFCKFYHSNEPFIDVSEQFDVILLSYASFYMDFKKFVTLMENQKNCKIGWITNEYNLEPNSSFKKFITFIISNFEQYGKWKNYQYLMVNLNSLLMRDRGKEFLKKYDMIYYGTYRPDREKYFKKYLKGDFLLSTSSKNMKRYKSLGCDCRYMNKLIWRKGSETLNLFKASLYIEDEKTHELYNHLANRFYEGLIFNVVPFFDKSCMNTIQKSGYSIGNFFIVDSYEEIAERVKQIPNDIVNKSMAEFYDKAMTEKDQALKDIYEFIGGLK